MLNFWGVLWFVFDVIRFPPLFISTSFFLELLLERYQNPELKEVSALVALQYALYSYNGLGGVIRIYVRGGSLTATVGISILGYFFAVDYYRNERMRVDEQLAKLIEDFHSLKIGLFSPQATYRNQFNSLMRRRKLTCEVCFQKKHEIEFCAPCNNKNHKVCVECFALYLDDGLKSPNGSMFCCPFGEKDCSFLSGKKVKNIFNHFRMDYFQKTLFQDLSPDVIESRVDQAIIKNVTLTLLETGDALRCPFEECTNCVLYFEEDMENAETFNRNVENTEKSRPPKSNGLFQMLTSRMGFAKRKKDEARIATSVLNATHIGSADEILDLRMFKCIGCSKASCVVCFKPWTIGKYNHSSVSCNEYARLATKMEEKWNEQKEATRKALKRKIMRGSVRPCPHCDELIEKNGGCDQMVCQKCDQPFVWWAALTWNFNDAALDL